MPSAESPLKIARAAARATLTLPFQIPAKDWFSPREAAACIGMSKRWVEEQFALGKHLNGHVHKGGTLVRPTLRIPKVWIQTCLLLSSRYDDESFDDAVISIFKHRPPASLLRYAEAARREIANRPMSPDLTAPRAKTA